MTLGARISAALIGLLLVVQPAWAQNAASSVSKLNLDLKIPLSVLEEAANRNLPESFSQSGTGPDKCGRVFGARVCIGTRYSYEVRRTAPIKLSRAGDRLRGNIGLAISGKGGFRGDGARLVGLNAKNFRAAAEITGDIALTVSPDWCVRANATFQYRWTSSPRVEIIGGVWIDIEGAVKGEVDKAMRDLERRVQQAVPCEVTRAAVAKIWPRTSLPFQVGGQTLYLNIDPSALGRPVVTLQDDLVSLSLAARAATSLASRRGPEEAKPDLPNATDMAADHGRVDLSIPIRIDQSILQDALSQAVAGRRFEGSTPAGSYDVQLSQTSLSLHSDRMEMSARLEGRMPLAGEAAGRVTFRGRPVHDPGGNVVVRDPDVSLDLEGGVASVLDTPLSLAFNSLLGEIVAIDAEKARAEVRKGLSEALADLSKTGGIAFSLNEVRMTIERFAAVEGAVEARVRLTGRLDAEVTVLQ